MINLVIFDFDGVIIDSKLVMGIAFTESYKKIVGTESRVPFDEFMNHSGDSLKNIFKVMNLPVNKMYDEFRKLSVKNNDKICLFKNIIDVLKRLKTDGIKIAILTGKERDRTTKLLDQFHINDLFDLVVTSTDITRSKPNPEGVRKILKELDMSPDEALGIGDATNDILAYKKAGVKSVAATWGYFDEKMLSEVNPDYLIRNAEEIFDIISNEK